jgi:O-antigen/teichoic acid export membrane protein
VSETRKLFSNSLIIFIGTIVGSAFSYLFNMLMGRMLGPEKYGAMSALLSLLMIVSVGGGAVTTLTSRYTSDLYHQQYYHALRRLFATMSRYILVLSLVLIVVGIVLAPAIAGFFSIESAVPVIIVLVSLLFGNLLAVNRGILQGMQSFAFLSASSVLEMLAKLLLGVGLVSAGYALNGAVGALVITGVIVYIATWYVVRRGIAHADGVERKDPFTFDKKEIIRYAVPTLISTFLIAITLNLDVIMVKHLFSATDAGLYAAVSTVAKIILYITAPIASVMFPMVAERQTKGDKHYKLLALSVKMTLLGGLVILGVYTVMPSKVLSLLYGAQYAGAYELLPLVGLSILFYSIVNLLALYYLSVKDYAFLWFFAFIAVVQVGWVYLWHPSLMIVVRIFISTFGLLCFLMIAYYIYSKREQVRLFLKGEYGDGSQAIDYHSGI